MTIPVIPMNEKSAYTAYTVSTPTTDFAIGFDYAEDINNIIVRIDDVPIQDTTYSATLINPLTVQITPAVPLGVVRISRETNIDENLHKFSGGALFTATTVDANFEQMRNAQQELRDETLHIARGAIIEAKVDAEVFARSTADATLQSNINTETALRITKDSYAVRSTDFALNPLVAAIARVGKFLSFDADGQPTMASGLGADSGLRTDLAKSTGALLVGSTNGSVQVALNILTASVTSNTTNIAGTTSLLNLHTTSIAANTAAIATNSTAITGLTAAIAAGAGVAALTLTALSAITGKPVNTLGYVTNDPTPANNGMYQWNGTVWTKSIYDPVTQSIAYTDSVLPFSVIGNLYSAANNFAGFYVSGAGVVTVNAASLIQIVDVEAGKQYALQATGINANFIAATGTSSTLTSGQALTYATMTQGAQADVRVVTIPAGATKLYINVKVGTTFDVTGSIAINKGVRVTTTVATNVVSKARGVSIVDARIEDATVLLKDTDLTVVAINIYDKTTNVASRYINSSSGVIPTSTGTELAVIPVTEGLMYSIYSPDWRTGLLAIGFRTSATINTTDSAPLATLTSTTNALVKTINIPMGLGYTYIVVNTKLPASSFNITDTLAVNIGDFVSGDTTKKVRSIRGFPLDTGIASTPVSSVLKGKSWAVIGDSITAKNYRTVLNYHDYVSNSVGGMAIYNYGLGGTGYFDRSGAASTITESPDYITVFFGANDMASSLPLGTVSDTTTATTAGCINILLSALVTKFYDKKIAVFTQLPRDIYWGVGGTANAMGVRGENLADMIKAVAGKYSLPCLDLYRESNLAPWIPAANTLYFKAIGYPPDGLHPNDAGQQLEGYKVQKFLESI